MDKLEIAYTVDLLSRLIESIETYLDDDRWDGIESMHKEIKEANKWINKYYKRIEAEIEQQHKEEWIRQTNKEIREGAV
jgi:DNA-binding transcriptional regulator GbsR (MarR family)